MDKTVLIFAASAVLLPLVIGVVLGQIPKEIFVTWALPLAAATLGLLFAIRYIEGLTPPLRLAASIIFGLFWLAGGGFVLRKRFTTENQPTPPEKTARMFGIMFLLFGFLWIAVSIVQYYQTRG